MFLFVVMQPGYFFSNKLVHDLKQAIRRELSNKHVPRFVIGVQEIPMTVNGKKVETLIKQIISSGEIPKQVSGTVANPGCLDSFRQYHRLELTRSTGSKL